MIAIGGEGSSEKGENLVLVKYNNNGDNNSSADSGGGDNNCSAWSNVWSNADKNSLNIDGPVNILRFAQNGSGNHVLAIGAAAGGVDGFGVTILHIGKDIMDLKGTRESLAETTEDHEGTNNLQN